MGIFSRKKKSPSPGQASPSPSIMTVVPSCPSSPALQIPGPILKPQFSLRVALDPAPMDQEEGVFVIRLDTDATFDQIRNTIAEHTGSPSMSLFKTFIPLSAHTQAVEYRRRYSTPVNLLTTFSCYNMDDPRQIELSFGGAFNCSPKVQARDMKLKDWFHESSSDETISIIVRTSESSSTSVPLTFITHFAPSEPTFQSRAAKSAHQAPTVVTAPIHHTVRQLKSAILKANGRNVMEEHLNRVVLWQVEMSQDEMIIIGERGGLKNGRMPWPYPPGAPIPVAMSDDSLPISHFFTGKASCARMVAISVWLDSTASAAMPRLVPCQPIPPFVYPMNYPSETHADLPTPVKRRQRPSTAPAVVVTIPGQDALSAIKAFGSTRPLTSIRGSITPRPDVLSPNTTIINNAQGRGQRGLGITSPTATSEFDWKPKMEEYSITRSNTLPRNSISSNESCSTGSFEHEKNLPSLSFSQLDLTLDSPDEKGLNLLTPPIEKGGYDWMGPSSVEAKKGVQVLYLDQKLRKFAF